MAGVEIRECGPEALDRVAEVDRTERVEAEYIAVQSDDGRSLALERAEVDPPLHIGPWTVKGIERRIKLWKPKVDAGGLFLGAFMELRLVGFAILGPVQSDQSCQLCALFVDSHHRRRDIGSRLLSRAERVARERGGASLWIDSNGTASAVEFYLRQGYEAIGLNSNALVKHRIGHLVFARAL